jgi:hypothetical protein
MIQKHRAICYCCLVLASMAFRYLSDAKSYIWSFFLSSALSKVTCKKRLYLKFLSEFLVSYIPCYCNVETRCVRCYFVILKVFKLLFLRYLRSLSCRSKASKMPHAPQKQIDALLQRTNPLILKTVWPPCLLI